MNKKMHIVLLCGGQSCEHEVSVKSSHSAMQAMDKDKYDVTLIGISKKGSWLYIADPKHQIKSDTIEDGVGQSVRLDYQGSRRVFFDSDFRPLKGIVDVVLPILHGPFGEDGTIQGLLELSGIPYAGSGVSGSAVAMDKQLMRRMFTVAGLPQVDYTVIRRDAWKDRPDEIQKQVEKHLAYPVFIKPASMGSSVGISKAHNGKEFAVAMNEAATFDFKIMIEEAVHDCREIEASIIGNWPPQVASTVGEIVPGKEFYDYGAKYVDNSTQLFIPARINQSTVEKVRTMAGKAFEAVDAAGLSRVDFFVSQDEKKIWLNEINTMPGFTTVSMFPKLWEASGVTYSQIIDRIIDLALERSQDKQANRISL